LHKIQLRKKLSGNKVQALLFEEPIYSQLIFVQNASDTLLLI